MWVKFIKIFKKLYYLSTVKMATQEEMFSGFNACTHRVDCITKTKSKFMFIKIIKL